MELYRLLDYWSASRLTGVCWHRTEELWKGGYLRDPIFSAVRYHWDYQPKAIGLNFQQAKVRSNLASRKITRLKRHL